MTISRCPSRFLTKTSSHTTLPHTQNVLPDILAVVQVALEGAISRKAAASSLSRGELPSGDLLPWTVSQQFQVRAEQI